MGMKTNKLFPGTIIPRKDWIMAKHEKRVTTLAASRGGDLQSGRKNG